MIYEMAIADILPLPSVDSEGAAFNNGAGDWSLENTLAWKDVSGPYYDRLKRQLEIDGFNRVPLHVDLAENMYLDYNTYVPVPDKFHGKLMMGNGHHRLKLMISLGFTHALVTDDNDLSCEGDEVIITSDEQCLDGYDT